MGRERAARLMLTFLVVGISEVFSFVRRWSSIERSTKGVTECKYTYETRERDSSKAKGKEESMVDVWRCGNSF